MSGGTAGEGVPPAPPGWAKQPVYLDYNGTTPVDPRVVEAMLPYLSTYFGNPSSIHAFGAVPRAAMARARAQVAGLIGALAHEVVFTGSGSEADATAIRGIVTAARRRGVRRPHVITEATEHPAVLAACAYTERHHDADVTVLGVVGDGLVSPRQLAEAVRPETVLVSIMHANNETGVVQPIAELARIAHEGGALLHTDAAQSVGKIAVDVTGLGVDLLTLVGHKFYAPKGVAALYVRDGLDLEPLIGGGGQEGGRRAGTENVASVVALGAAADLAAAELVAGSAQRLQHLRDRLFDDLDRRLPGAVHLHGGEAPRLPQTLNVSLDGIAGPALLDRCPGLAASTGSACHAGTTAPSPVLTAMGVPVERASGAVRLSLGRWSTEADIATAAQALAGAAGLG
ncbi:cysteine desulfurase family protein [Rhodococcus ruber]|uniref:cysteine desulfurase family protein n=1 Tax=Rhodococcus ruber TaxID=1830 RepID=UPI000E6B18C2|nr:cysteine desulfurase family protein [Rhodococcus ruber]AXY49372.1 Cysteine desulfurase [Rhodococcus ruber]